MEHFLKRVAENTKEKLYKAKKAAVITAGMLSVAGSAHAETKDTGKTGELSGKKTEVTYEAATPSEEKTLAVYQERGASSETVNFESYFKVDKADISPEDQEKIQTTLGDFFTDMHTTDNMLLRVSGQKIVIEASADEWRAGEEWNHSNEQLSLARAESLKQVVRDFLETFDFPGHGFSAEDAQSLLAMPVIVSLPHHGEERGVTYLTHLINPATQKQYTQEEIAALSPNEVTELRKDARYVRVGFEIKKQDEHTKEIQESKSDAPGDVLRETLSEMKNGYDELIVVADNSGSMHDISRTLVDRELAVVAQDAPKIRVGLFSNTLNALQTYTPETTLSSLIDANKMGHSKESLIGSALELQKHLHENTKTAMLLITDEYLQGVTIEKLRELEAVEAKGNKVLIMMLDDTHAKGKIFTVNDLYQRMSTRLKREIHQAKELKDRQASEDRLAYLYKDGYSVFYDDHTATPKQNPEELLSSTE